MGEDEEYVKEARQVLAKLDRRIKRLMNERERLSKEIQQFVKGVRSFVKVCPFCGGPINPFKAKKPTQHSYGQRIFTCSKCSKTFMVRLKKP